MVRYADTAGNTLPGQTQDRYDPAGNLTEVQHTNSSSSVLEDFQYTPDAANRLSSETDTLLIAGPAWGAGLGPRGIRPALPPFPYQRLSAFGTNPGRLSR